jgi:hypothetical protein
LARADPAGLARGYLTPPAESAVRAVAHPPETEAVALVRLARRLPARRRAALLQAEMDRYLRRGFRVLSQTPYSAQLVRPKQFSCLLATLGLLLFGVGLLVYLADYGSRRDLQVFLTVDEYGQLRRTTHGERTIEGGLAALLWVGIPIFACAGLVAVAGSAGQLANNVGRELTRPRTTAAAFLPPPELSTSDQVVLLDVRTWTAQPAPTFAEFFGAPFREVAIAPGWLQSLPKGGIARSYRTTWGTIEALFAADRAVGFYLRLDPGSSPATFDDALQSVNLPGGQPPDVQGDTVRQWKNLAGFAVQLTAGEATGANISQVAVWQAD